MTDLNDTSVFRQVDSDNIDGLPSFPEGMPVANFNENLRASQGALARWYSRTNPTLRSSGSGTAQSVLYDVGPLSHVVGDVFRFIVGTTNTGATTLNFGPGDIPVVAFGAPLVGGEMVEDWIACVAFTGAGTFELLNPHGRITGDTSITGELSVVGDLAVSGDSVLSGDVTVGDALGVNGALSVSGIANFAGAAAVGGNFNVTGTTSLAGPVVIDGQLSLNNDTIIVSGHKVRLLSADTFFYISTTGNDSSGDGSVDAPWATLAHAAAVIQATTNFGGFRVSLLLEPGLYSSTSTMFAPTTGSWEIVSSTLAANDVHLSCSGIQQDCIHPIGDATVFVTEVTVGATGGFALCSSGGSYLTIGHVVVTASLGHITSFDGGNVQVNENIVFAGGAQTVFFCEAATLVGSSSGTPIFYSATGALPVSNAFAVCTSGGFLRLVSANFGSISATGVRFAVSANGIIGTNGADPLTFLPGTVAGTQTSGGIFV